MAITMENIQDAWVRRIEFSHFAGSAVAVYETASRVTVEDCISLSPVSEIVECLQLCYHMLGVLDAGPPAEELDNVAELAVVGAAT